MKSQKSGLVWLVLLSMVLGLVACGGETGGNSGGEGNMGGEDFNEPEPMDSSERDLILVGAAHALSGPVGLYGQAIKNGIDLAVNEINGQDFLGDGVQFRVIFEDTRGEKEAGVAAFEKLIEEDGVVAILGPTLSDTAFVADPVAQESGIPVIGSSNTAIGITDMGDYVFRTSLPESAVIPNTLQVLVDSRGIARVAILYGNDDQFTQSGYQVFATSLAALGVEVLVTETFVQGDTDFSEQLAAIEAVNPDAIIVSALASEAAQIMVQARAMGLEAPIVGGNGFNSPQLADLAGEAAEGAISGSAWFVDNPNEANQAFVAAYRKAFGTGPDQFAAQSYTATWVLAHAIKNADSTEPAAIRDALASLPAIDTPLGMFSFDVLRDPVHEPVVLIVRDGEFALYDE
ncbi:MAG TPA: ABC transporter substrate-binding protein [Anaerolineae bacterium]|nr:ABC transporter substrate-binding protein [Anaerolineae bacterium]